jgi:two-component system sensor histidine kinase ArlS
MNLKTRTSLAVSLLFTGIFGLSAAVIYFLFADFRKEEFESRLNQKAVSTIKLLVEVEQVDRQLLKIIDQNTIQKLYDEKTLIFDENYNLIYSSLDDTKIDWTIQDLEYLKNNQTFFKKDKEKEIYGYFYDTQEKDFYALISAKDNYGKRKLEYLLFILILTYLIFTTLIWMFIHFFVKNLLSPLDSFIGKIKGINELNLDTRIEQSDNKNEIDQLAHEFNLMLERLHISYQKQKEFTAHASHELRTPVSRLIAQLENKIRDVHQLEEVKVVCHKLLLDVNQLKELTQSLLLLAKYDNNAYPKHEICRIDDIIFDCSEELNKLYPDFKLDFTFGNIETLEFYGNAGLLKIAFQNLLRNAYFYAENKLVHVHVESTKHKIKVDIINDGALITEEEQSNLFDAFMRGLNAKEKSGFGLGLKIVQRILHQHHATVQYEVSPANQNHFKLIFNKIQL